MAEFRGLEFVLAESEREGIEVIAPAMVQDRTLISRREELVETQACYRFFVHLASASAFPFPFPLSSHPSSP